MGEASIPMLMLMFMYERVGSVRSCMELANSSACSALTKYDESPGRVGGKRVGGL